MNVVRWYSFMQSMAAEACKDLGIAPLTFDYDSINIHMPIPKVMESKKAAKKAERQKIPHAKSAYMLFAQENRERVKKAHPGGEAKGE